MTRNAIMRRENTATPESDMMHDPNEIRFMTPRNIGADPFESPQDSESPQELDPQLLPHTNGRNSTEERLTDAQLAEALKRLETADHGNEWNGYVDSASGSPNGPAEDQVLEDKLIRDKVIISVIHSDVFFFFEREILKNCSSGRLRNYLAKLEPTSPPIIWLQFEEDEEITFYMHWMMRNPRCINNSFAREYKGTIQIDWEALLDFYRLGWRMRDPKFLNFIIDKWIDAQDRKFFCASLAKKIYDELPQDSHLTRLYVETWATASNHFWMRMTMDGLEGPQEFREDVIKVHRLLRQKYPGGVPPNLKNWRFRPRYYYKFPPREAVAPEPNGVQPPASTTASQPAAPRSNGVQQPESIATTQLPVRSRPENPAAAVQRPEHPQTQAPGPRGPRRPGEFRPRSARRMEADSSRPERCPSPDEESELELVRRTMMLRRQLDEHKEQMHLKALEEEPVPEEVARRWTSGTFRRLFSI
ncbi:uncharacterized protein BKA78DRAFT_297125 [Phyllosticta capitalensis]|uniref:uncharacterized protein n=1 Tax=Phyllosticta capitalensis TaxID=121624 RepID=UPI00312D2094